MIKIRVVRKLVIEGPEEWVMQTLEHCVVSPGHPYVVPVGGTITEEERYEDTQFRNNQLSNTSVKIQDIK